jgi:hypothetical protein
MRFESQLSRMNCQMFSCGLSSEHFAGNGMSVILNHAQTSLNLPQVPNSLSQSG